MGLKNGVVSLAYSSSHGCQAASFPSFPSFILSFFSHLLACLLSIHASAFPYLMLRDWESLSLEVAPYVM